MSNTLSAQIELKQTTFTVSMFVVTSWLFASCLGLPKKLVEAGDVTGVAPEPCLRNNTMCSKLLMITVSSKVAQPKRN